MAPVGLDLVERRPAREVKVGEDEVARRRIAFEFQAKAVTHDAVRAVAADHPVDVDRFLAPVRAAQEGRHGVFVGDEADQFDLSLDLDAKRI